MYINLTEYVNESPGSMKFMFVKKSSDLSAELQKIYEVNNLFSSLHTKINSFTYQATKQSYPVTDGIKVINSEACLQLKNDALTEKKHIFIFEEFDNDAFRHIENMKNI